MAAGYIITSTKQIAPKVLKKLKGNRGPRGFKGKTGAQGAKGVPGAPGPSTGGFVSSSASSATLGTTGTNVIALSQGTGAIVAPANGLLLITASGDFTKSNASGLSEVGCTLEMSTNGGAFSPISRDMERDFSTLFESEALTVSAGAHVNAGSKYNVALNCTSAIAAVAFIRGDMTAVFVG